MRVFAGRASCLAWSTLGQDGPWPSVLCLPMFGNLSTHRLGSWLTIYWKAKCMPLHVHTLEWRASFKNWKRKWRRPQDHMTGFVQSQWVTPTVWSPELLDQSDLAYKSPQRQLLMYPCKSPHLQSLMYPCKTPPPQLLMYPCKTPLLLFLMYPRKTPQPTAVTNVSIFHAHFILWW